MELLQEQICTFEQAQKLKELGVTRRSIAMYAYHFGVWMPLFTVDGLSSETYPAYTVGELGFMLPTAYDTQRLTSETGNGEIWRCYDDNGNDVIDWEYNTEAEARAAALIMVLNEGILSLTQVNNDTP